MGCEKSFSDEPEPVTKELRYHIGDLKTNEKHDQRSRTYFLEEYGGTYLCDVDIDQRYAIDDEDICFVKKDVYAPIGNPYHPDVT